MDQVAVYRYGIYLTIHVSRLNDRIISVHVSNNVFVLRVIMYDKDKPICNLIHYFTRAMTSRIPPMLLYWLVIFYDT